MSLAFDTLGYSKALQAGGINRKEADAHAEAARDFIMANLVTKNELRNALLAQTVAFGVMLASAVAFILSHM